MLYLVFKYLITATVVVTISEIAKRSDKIGALISSLPLVTILVLIWLYIEKQPISKINNHAFYTFWYVVPTLPAFLAFPFLNGHFGFWAALLIYILITILSFIVFATILKHFDINLI